MLCEESAGVLICFVLASSDFERLCCTSLSNSLECSLFLCSFFSLESRSVLSLSLSRSLPRSLSRLNFNLDDEDEEAELPELTV